ncbi:MAG: hypothetical protein HKN39_05360 [Flavobacteriales bacterium]|nr:hypothetical protein [Flavobacteriales bacterium]
MEIVEVLAYVLPSIIVLFVAYFMFKRLLAEIQLAQKEPVKSRMGNAPSSHINYQAYERLVLYLERINPSNMVLRTHKNGMSKKALQADMVKGIREEYEHNLSQQIYVSDEIWQTIKQARQETINLVNLASKKVGPSGTAKDLGKLLIEMSTKVEKLPHDVAIHYLKEELRDKVT